MVQILSVNSRTGKNEDIKDSALKRLWNWFSSKDLFTRLAFITILLLVIITPYMVYERFNIINRAAGQEISLYYVKAGGTTPLSTLSLARGETVDLKLYLDTGRQEINGFDITMVQSTSNITLSQPGVIEETGGARFNTPLFNTYQNNTWRFAKVHTDTNAIISGTLHLATLHFTASQDGSGTLQVFSSDVTSPQFDTVLPVSRINIAYFVTSPSNTPAPIPPTLRPTNAPIYTPAPTIRPTNIPLPTATPRPTSNPPLPAITTQPTLIPPVTAPSPIPADVDRNGCVGIVDFNLWFQAFTGNPAPNTYPDINSDGKITIQDFNIWFRTMRGGSSLCP